MRTTVPIVVLSVWVTACAAPLDPDDPSLLKRPFTAAEIADAMPAGTVIDMEQATPTARGGLRWTVVEADDDGCVIEYAALNDNGHAIALTQRKRHGWNELREHASYPAATSTVENDRRLTPLGLLDGRLYTMNDPQKGTVTRVFFSPMYPGPPVWMEVTRGGSMVSTMQQTARR